MGNMFGRRHKYVPDMTGSTIPPDSIPDIDIGLTRRHLAEEDRFFRSDKGKIIDSFILFAQLVQLAPNAEKERVAREFVAFAPDAARAFYAMDVMYARQAREANVPYEPAGLPEHPGFHRLAFICEREKHFDEAIALCAEARRQGWHGDWDKTMARCRARQAGLAKHPRHPKPSAAA